MKRRRWDSKTKMKIVLEGLSGRPVFVFQACRAAINHYRPKMRYIFELVAAIKTINIVKESTRIPFFCLKMKFD